MQGLFFGFLIEGRQKQGALRNHMIFGVLVHPNPSPRQFCTPSKAIRMINASASDLAIVTTGSIVGCILLVSVR